MAALRSIAFRTSSHRRSTLSHTLLDGAAKPRSNPAAARSSDASRFRFIGGDAAPITDPRGGEKYVRAVWCDVVLRSGAVYALAGRLCSGDEPCFPDGVASCQVAAARVAGCWNSFPIELSRLASAD